MGQVSVEYKIGKAKEYAKIMCDWLDSARADLRREVHDGKRSNAEFLQMLDLATNEAKTYADILEILAKQQ